MWSNEDDIEDGQCYTCGRKDLPVVVCSICDEWEYCTNCRIVCQCGHNPEHYLCNSDGHFCEGENPPGYGCSTPVCLNAQFLGLSQSDMPTLCSVCTAPLNDRMKELVTDALSYEELEALMSKKKKVKE